MALRITTGERDAASLSWGLDLGLAKWSWLHHWSFITPLLNGSRSFSRIVTGDPTSVTVVAVCLRLKSLRCVSRDVSCQVGYFVVISNYGLSLSWLLFSRNGSVLTPVLTGHHVHRADASQASVLRLQHDHALLPHHSISLSLLTITYAHQFHAVL